MEEEAMIPWRLKFSGVRDYTPTVMDFSGQDDHILISGPNGAGKSTVTFCMGAVLYSSKVDLEGLKSNNLPTDQTWRARVELLFKNEGAMKVDAATFVQFRLDLEQKPGDPVKKEFTIQEGDKIDEWERATKFTSGGSLNFTEYKHQVLYKYAVDPDGFYLIWYQKEVNQFAVMHPEERFRIFSEMNAIDKIQKNWEESKELVKETEQSLQEAENKQGLNKLRLKQKQMELDRFHNRNQRLKDGFKDYYTGLQWLERYHLQQIDLFKQQIDTLNDDKGEKLDEKIMKEQELDKQSKHVHSLKEQLVATESQEHKLDQRERELTEQFRTVQENYEQISNEIRDITEKVNKIGMSEPEVKARLHEAKQMFSMLLESIHSKEKQDEEINEKLNSLRDELAQLNAHIQGDLTKQKQVDELIKLYTSSSAVQAIMDENERQLELNKEQLRTLEVKKKQLEKEVVALRENKVYSPRQEASLRYFEEQNIEAYPLRELLELDEAARPSDEQQFDAIKYTVFVNKKTFQPPNDLYHVPLPLLIPEKTITHLPERRIKIKDHLSDHLYAFAVKALWWTHTFFMNEKPMISTENLN